MFSFLFYLFILVVVIQIGYYGYLFSRFSFAKIQEVKNDLIPVSVLIACRNEAENLKILLPKLLLQENPNFEIIIVDDASSDATLAVAQHFSKKSNAIKILSIPKTDTYQGNKKNALTQAIHLAQYEHLLFTDADCIPVSNFWISEMSNQFSEEKQLILGYGAYRERSGWLNKLIRYETLLTAWQYFSYAKIGKPYMGVGRNIAYTKTLFDQVKGFSSHQNIKSGDDDLFVNGVGVANNVAICWLPNAHTISQPKTSLSDWIRQKRRHVTTATSYKSIYQFLLGLFYISQVLFYLLFFMLLFIGGAIKLILIFVTIRFIFYYFSLIPAANKLKENDLIRYAPFLELSLIVLQMCIFIANLWKKPKAW